MASAQTKKFRRNPHRYIDNGEGIWVESSCTVCNMSEVYHVTLIDSIIEKAKAVGVLLVGVALFTGLMVYLNTNYDHDLGPGPTAYDKCMSKGGSWAYSETAPDYCILDNR